MTTNLSRRSLLTRRSLLQMSALGVAGLVIGGRPLVSRGLGAVGVTLDPAGNTVQLTIRECLMEMVDLTRVPVWTFDTPQFGPRVPGPVMYVEEGSTVVVEITNQLSGLHAFAIPGVIASGPIAPGATVEIDFIAPTAGTYIYLDPLDAPINRAMGLAGMFVVTTATSSTPYSNPTTSVQNLFDDLGTTMAFPGDPWLPERSWNWVFSSVDPILNELVHRDPSITPDEFADAFHPAYFMLNGKSGYFASNDPASKLHGRVGQPALIRIANVGLPTHSPHIHGNHVFGLATWNDGSGIHEVFDNVIEHDTLEVLPLSSLDLLHPFVRPPDAYPWPPSDPSVFTTDLGGDGHPGMVYPMHCHSELSLLANGANYPQGLITHWVLEGDLREDWTLPGPGTGPPPSTAPSTTAPETTAPAKPGTPTSPPTSARPPDTGPPVPGSPPVVLPPPGRPPRRTLDIDRPATSRRQATRHRSGSSATPDGERSGRRTPHTTESSRPVRRVTRRRRGGLGDNRPI